MAQYAHSELITLVQYCTDMHFHEFVISLYRISTICFIRSMKGMSNYTYVFLNSKQYLDLGGWVG